MKRLLYVFAMLAIFSSCDDDFEYAFDKTPTERKAEANSELNLLLAEAEFGWKTTMILNEVQVDNTKPILGDFFVFKFTKNEGADDGIVTISSRSGSSDSEYAIGQEMGTTLRFVTPNPIFFWLVDPTYNNPTGYGAEMEYVFMKEEDGKLYFQGKSLGNQLVLEKASEQDADVSVIAESSANFLESNTKNFFFLEITGGVANVTAEAPLYVQISTPPYAQYFEESLKQVFYELRYVVDGVRTRTNAAGYIFTNDGILFSDPLVIGQDTISKLVYNEESDEWRIGNEGYTGRILSSELPLVATPGIVDLFIDDFFSRDYCLMLDPWGCFGPLADIMDDHMYSYEAPRLQSVSIKNKYVSPDGQDLGSGIVFEQYDENYALEFAFLPIKMIKEGENHIIFERNGDVVTEIDGAADKIANDAHLAKLFDLIFEEQGWMIGCDVITLDTGSVHYDSMFFNVAHPENQIEYMGSFY